MHLAQNSRSRTELFIFTAVKYDKWLYDKAYGNTAVAKPSEVTSLTAFRLAQIMDEVGLPPGVVNIVFGDGPGCGEGLGFTRLL